MADWDPCVNEIFLNALEQHGAERQAYLDAACGDDAELRRGHCFAAAAEKPWRILRTRVTTSWPWTRP